MSMDTNLKYSVGQVATLSMPSTGEKLLENTLLNDMQVSYAENLSTAKSENVVKQIEWQKLNQEFQYGTHNF